MLYEFIITWFLFLKTWKILNYFNPILFVNWFIFVQYRLYLLWGFSWFLWLTLHTVILVIFSKRKCHEKLLIYNSYSNCFAENILPVLIYFLLIQSLTLVTCGKIIFNLKDTYYHSLMTYTHAHACIPTCKYTLYSY